MVVASYPIEGDRPLIPGLAQTAVHRIAATLTLALLAVLPRPVGAAASPALPAGIVYASPTPGARFVHPETNLIIRFARPLASTALPSIVAQGATSGVHAGRTRLSDDGVTVVFLPERPFAAGESVDVRVDGRPLGRFAVAASRRAPSPFDPLAELEGGAGMLAHGLPPSAAATPGPSVLDAPLITTHLNGPTAPGQIFLSSFSISLPLTPFLLVVDDAGQPLFSRAMPSPAFDFKQQPDGRLTYSMGQFPQWYVMDSTFTVVDSLACGNGYLTDIHELRLLPNGHALLLGQEELPVDMSTVVPGGNPNATAEWSLIQELDTQKNVVFEWRAMEHFSITDNTHDDLTAAFIDVTHSNALEQDTDGNLLLSSRELDEITKIDRTTGAIVWRMGGKHNQFSLVGDDQWFSHQHAIRRLANGHVSLFDNGNFHSPAFSRALEYALDEPARTATLVWEFSNSPVTLSPAMGYAHRLANGSTLIGWGFGKPDVSEVDAQGNVLMTLNLRQGEFSYRAYRTEFFPAPTEVPPGPPVGLALSPNRPNPFHEASELFLALPARASVSCALFDAAGRRVRELVAPSQRGPGLVRIGVDLHGAPAGLYFVRAQVNGVTLTRRIVQLP